MVGAIPFPNISPEVFSVTVFGVHFALRWYALAYIAGILIGWRIAVAAVRRPTLWLGDQAPMTPVLPEALMTWIIVGVILGGRLGYVLIYKPAYYLAHPAEVIAVWQGGMSFHGGFLGVVVAVILWARAHRLRLSAVADLLALTCTPAIFLVRIANFINAELWGRPTDLPWGVIFPGEAAQDCIDVIFKACARHPSQLYESLTEGLILGALILWLAFRRGALKRPWALTGVFVTGYGLIRFCLEFVRQPDAQFQGPGNPLGYALQFGDWGLTMGQILSLPMFAVGVWLVLRARRDPA